MQAAAPPRYQAATKNSHHGNQQIYQDLEKVGQKIKILTDASLRIEVAQKNTLDQIRSLSKQIKELEIMHRNTEERSSARYTADDESAVGNMRKSGRMLQQALGRLQKDLETQSATHPMGPKTKRTPSPFNSADFVAGGHETTEGQKAPTKESAHSMTKSAPTTESAHSRTTSSPTTENAHSRTTSAPTTENVHSRTTSAPTTENAHSRATSSPNTETAHSKATPAPAMETAHHGTSSDGQSVESARTSSQTRKRTRRKFQEDWEAQWDDEDKLESAISAFGKQVQGMGAEKRGKAGTLNKAMSYIKMQAALEEAISELKEQAKSHDTSSMRAGSSVKQRD